MENSGWMLPLKVKKSESESWALPDVGKSLTLKSIAGIERPEKGRIVIDGVTLLMPEKRFF